MDHLVLNREPTREPTRVTLNASTIIDHISTSSPRNILNSGMCEVSLIDHYMFF